MDYTEIIKGKSTSNPIIKFKQHKVNGIDLLQPYPAWWETADKEMKIIIDEDILLDETITLNKRDETDKT